MLSTHPKSAQSWLVGGGELGELIRARDWSRTALGPLEGWQQTLRTAVGMLLSSRAQIILFWGPEFVVIYNDAYRPVFGGKHPSALGMTGREAWSEIWDDQLGPLLRGVVQSGESYWARDLLFCIQRHGYLEETYFDISYDPVRDETGVVRGVNCIVTETTGRVTGERRLRTLGNLGRIVMHARSVPAVLQQAAAVLRDNPEDIAFVLLYEWDARAGVARLRAASGIDPSHRAAVAEISPGAAGAWPLSVNLPSGGAIVDASSLEIPAGRWPEPCTRVGVLPIAMPSQAPDAFIVAGLSPRLAIDEAYRNFLQLVASGIGSALSNAKALEAERERVEALAELDRAKTAFFSNVSHEFRTPLTLLLGPLHEELSGRALRAEARGRLEVSYRNGLRLLKLVNALLDFSRIEAGRMQARFESTDLAVFTAELASNFQSACEKAGLALRVRCEPLSQPAFVDRDMWEKIVLNLLSNAFKFTFEGSIDVVLREADSRVELTVRDTGIGIAPESMPRLFERFHRIEGVRARTYEGSGIGLALVHELVTMHGGEIRAESRPGEGSTFRVSLPLGRSHLFADHVVDGGEAATARQAPMFVHEVMGWLRGGADAGKLPDIAPAPSEGRVERILVVDDNADMREYIQRLLGETWSVTTAADGHEALQALATARFDLVLTDVMMPGMDGFALLGAIRSDASLRDLPVIMLSARAGEEARIEGRGAGADDYLTKPFSARELVAQVRAQLATARARRVVGRERELLLASERAARMDAQRQWEDLVRLFEQAPNPMVILRGREHYIELANAAACEVWGRTAEQVMHKPLFDAIPEVRGQGLEKMLEGVLDTGEPFRGQKVAVRLDRGRGLETIYFDFVYSPLRATSGRVDGVAVTAFDVTDRIRAHEEARAAG